MKMELWIDKNLKKKGRGAVADLSRALKVGQDVISKMRKVGGGRRVRVDELPLIEQFFGEPFPAGGRLKPRETANVVKEPLGVSTGSARVVGEIGGGGWYESSISDLYSPDLPPDVDRYEPVPMVNDQRYNGAKQFALRVVGESVNKIIRDGDFAICVPYFEVREGLRDGDVVAVERTRHGLHQGTIKRLRRVGNTWELHPESTSPKFQDPLRLSDNLSGDRDDDGASIIIVGLVIGQYGAVS